MRKIAILLMAAAIVLIGLRVFTGIVHARDAETAFFVIKHVPSLVIERKESDADPVEDDVILYADEFQVPFGEDYTKLMEVSLVTIPVLLIASASLLYRARRTRRGRTLHTR